MLDASMQIEYKKLFIENVNSKIKIYSFKGRGAGEGKLGLILTV
jgi:hypothetical protein